MREIAWWIKEENRATEAQTDMLCQKEEEKNEGIHSEMQKIKAEPSVSRKYTEKGKQIKKKRIKKIKDFKLKEFIKNHTRYIKTHTKAHYSKS